MTQRGLDHEVTYGRAGVVIRRRRPGADGLDVPREAALLRIIRATTTVPVPRVLRTWPARGVIEMERVPGVSLLDHLPCVTEADALRLGRDLGELVAALARIPVVEVADLVPRDVPEPQKLLAEALATWEQVHDHVPTALRQPVEKFLAIVPDLKPRGLVLTHQDLGAEHVFVDGPALQISGIIDWSDAALGDPAVDLGLILRDLGEAAGECAVARFAARGLETDELIPRALFHARVRALEDLAYGLAEHLPAYRDNALRAIARLFRPEDRSAA